MKSTLKKIGILSMSALLAFGALTACKPSTSRPGGGSGEFGYEDQIDSSKTQLFISNFNGAFGDSWLKAAAQRYSALHENDSYEKNKKGVQVYIDNAKQSGSDVLAGMTSSRDDIFFTEFAYYYDFVNSGKCLDLTDIVTSKLTKYGENKSILDKLTSEQKTFYDANGRYYALPHYQAFRGISYDIGMFEDELLYLSANKNNGNDGFILSTDDTYSNGPDGVAGTYDDGLPATYDEFFKLCDKMKSQGITPVIWSGSNQAYFTEFLTALAADYEGLEQMTLNFTFDGVAKNIVESIDANGKATVSAPVSINKQDAYKLAGQAGKYYALKFAERLINGGYFDLRSFGTLSHTECQKEYLYSNYATNRKPIAMIIESNYWENEASDAGYFDQMAKTYGKKVSRENRRFGFMPFPKATEEKVGEGVTLVDYLYSGAFIKSNIASYKKDLALDFLQFLYTDVSLNEFSTITGCPKSLVYNFDSSTNKVSPYTEAVFAMRERSDVVFPFGNSDMYKDNASAFSITSFWSAEVGGVPYNTPSKDIRNDNISALQFFNGAKAHFSQAKWSNNYSRYWN